MKETNPVVCPQCRMELKYVGMKKFHEGSPAFAGWGFFLSDLDELFVHREHFDIYV